MRSGFNSANNYMGAYYCHCPVFILSSPFDDKAASQGAKGIRQSF
jgi:hypothetical protein